jgi:hypothetical protein
MPWVSEEAGIEARYRRTYTLPIGAEISATVYHDPRVYRVKFGEEAVRRVLEEGETVEAYDTQQFIVEADCDGTWYEVKTLKHLYTLEVSGFPLRIDGERVNESEDAREKLAYLIG